VRRPHQQVGDLGRLQHETEAERRRLGVVAADRQIDRGDQVLAGAVLVDAVAEHERLRALGDEGQHGARHRDRRLVGAGGPADQDSVDGRGDAGAGVAVQERTQFVERHPWRVIGKDRRGSFYWPTW
jgi:hypothetical protein